MWKHRAYAKAIIRGKDIKLKATTQLVYLLLADHASEDKNSTYFTTRRLCDMTQCAAATIRKAVKTLEDNNLVITVYYPGKAPVYTIVLPSGWAPGSDTSISTAARAYIPTLAERQSSSLEATLKLLSISEEEMARMVYTGIEGMNQAEAQARAEALFKGGSSSPGFRIIEQLGIARNTPVAQSDSAKALQADRARQHTARLRENALTEQLIKWEAPRAGETYQDLAARKKAGFPGTDDQLLAYKPADYSALGH